MDTASRNFERFVDSYLANFEQNGQTSFISLRPFPSMSEMERIVEDLLELLFPGRSGGKILSGDSLRDIVSTLLGRIGNMLEQQIYLAWYHENPLSLAEHETQAYRDMTHDAVEKLFSDLPTLRKMMKEDAQSTFDGDPAATSVQETIICYPGIRALTIHRIAHCLYSEGVPLIPRMLSETVHKQTGIDIHPGATIGRCLCIDHGTGVVIGETAVIGDQVKLYQGVTLGALSFPKDACGALVRGSKRHPTLGNRVTVYANATLLGDITIGDNAIIGSNAWIRQDVPADTLVQNEEPKIIMRTLSRLPSKKTCDPKNQ